MEGKKEVTKKYEDGITVKITFTEGYEKRFTDACLNVLRRRNTVKEPVKTGIA